MSAPERWTLDHDGAVHEVVIAEAGLRRHVTWRVDGALVAETRTVDETVRLQSGEDGGRALLVRLPRFVGPARQVTLLDEPGTGPAPAMLRRGADFTPEPGSRAARREQRIREHPGRHELQATLVGVVRVIAPIVAVALLARLAFSLPWPDVPVPDLPAIRVPLPAIPWPDWSLPSVHVPGWVTWTTDKAKYVVPVVAAYVIARGEVRRRRAQDERRAEAGAGEAERDDGR